jgi:hypothetical protein
MTNRRRSDRPNESYYLNTGGYLCHEKWWEREGKSRPWIRQWYYRYRNHLLRDPLHRLLYRARGRDSSRTEQRRRDAREGE